MGNFGGRLSKREIEEIRKEVDLSEERIQQEFVTFKKSCKHGKKITKKEFIDLYQEMFEGDAKDFAENIFRKFDKNQNGHVDFVEYLLVLNFVSGKNIEEKLKWSFEIYDINGDGSIDKGEMSAIIKAVYRLHDILTDDEETNENTIKQLCDGIFLKMDTNKDGLISLDEFTSGARSDERIVRMLQGDMFETGEKQK